MNKYFLVSKLYDQTYAIISGPANLPESFGSTSGFHVLADSSPEMLTDLSWQQNPNLGFWLAVYDTKPDYNYNEKISESYVLNVANKNVKVTYTIQTLTQEELDGRIEGIKRQIRMIRDKYLSLTDFTQLSDAPISSEAKVEFATFRQQLRDLPNATDIFNVTWPSIPTSANINLPPFPQMPSYKI